MQTGDPVIGSRSLGIHLVLVTLGFSFVFTLFAVGARTLSAWNEAWAAMNAELILLEQVYQPTLTKAIWEMDRDALNAQIKSTAQVAAVGRIELKLNSVNRKPELIERSVEGWQPSTLAPTRHLDLVYAPFPGGSERVGELTLAGDERVLWLRLRNEIQGIVLTQLLQSLLLAGLIMLLFHRTVTVHVRHIARHLDQLTPQTMGGALQLARNPHNQDELGLLEAGINQLQSKLTDHLTQLQHYEDELGAHRDHLAELVRARTAELESITRAQQLVLSLSNRLIHSPHEQFDACQKECWCEVAQRLGARHALWLTPVAGQTSWQVFVQWQPHGTPPQSPLLETMARVPNMLAREELLFFADFEHMAASLGEAEAAGFVRDGAGACALALLRSDGEDHGVLFVCKPVGRSDWSDEERALLAMTAQMLLHSVRHKAQLVAILATQEALRSANRQLEVLSLHDALTGLSNRRHFDDMKEDEFQRALRSNQPLSLLICDIDFFKAYNDHYGHAQGDQCLRDVARAMGAAIARSGDALARIGGEEFAILLPATTAQAAWQVAERVRQAVANLRIAHSASVAESYVTISIGLAQMEIGRTPDFDALFEAADQALYRAKEHGRNRIEATPAMAQPDAS